jgi:molybdate transport system ATP-binding protein
MPSAPSDVASTTIRVRLRKRLGTFDLDVEFAAPAPGVVALFGRSGCGKSTIVNLIAGLHTPDAGTVRLGDQLLYDSEQGIDVPTQARRIGYVFQDSRLFPHLDVLGNLRYGDRRAPAAARYVSFDEVVDLLGLAGLLARRSRELSGGERQRVALGRALLCHPRALLLDEPLASLDRPRRAELLPYLERLRDRLSIPIIYVSHEFDEVLQLATHIVLLEAGRVTAQGEVGSVSLRPELRAIVGSDALGAIVESEIEALDPAAGLARLRVGINTLNVQAAGLQIGQAVRVQLLARDLILAIEPPRGLSVRNCLAGVLARISADDPGTYLVEVDIGGPRVLAQVTASAAAELHLETGRNVWVLVKAVSLRGHVYRAGAAAEATASRDAVPARAARASE